jgi:hypothetical protein
VLRARGNTFERLMDETQSPAPMPNSRLAFAGE